MIQFKNVMYWCFQTITLKYCNTTIKKYVKVSQGDIVNITTLK